MAATRTSPEPVADPDADRELRRVHLLLTVQSVLVVLVAVNRLGAVTGGYVASNQFLRWVDLLNLLVLPLASVLATYLLRQALRYGGPRRGGLGDRALGVMFVVGVYLLAAGYGVHEVTNYLHVRFCSPPAAGTGQLCGIVVYNDDDFSHLVFFVGFLLINVSVLLLPVLFPARRTATGAHLAAIGANAAVFGLGIFANLAFEDIGLDLYVVAAVALVAAAVWWRRRLDPIPVYYLLTYWLSLLATLAYKIFG